MQSLPALLHVLCYQQSPSQVSLSPSQQQQQYGKEEADTIPVTEQHSTHIIAHNSTSTNQSSYKEQLEFNDDSVNQEEEKEEKEEEENEAKFKDIAVGSVPPHIIQILDNAS